MGSVYEDKLQQQVEDLQNVVAANDREIDQIADIQQLLLPGRSELPEIIGSWLLNRFQVTCRHLGARDSVQWAMSLPTQLYSPN